MFEFIAELRRLYGQTNGSHRARFVTSLMPAGFLGLMLIVQIGYAFNTAVQSATKAGTPAWIIPTCFLVGIIVLLAGLDYFLKWMIRTVGKNDKS